MIQRYEPYTNGTMIDYDCKESEDGDYVKYEDHVKCVTYLEQKLKNKEHAIGLMKELQESLKKKLTVAEKKNYAYRKILEFAREHLHADPFYNMVVETLEEADNIKE